MAESSSSELAAFDPVADDPGPAGFVRRHRVHLMGLGMVVLIATARPTLVGMVAGVTVAVAGEGLRIWSAGVISKIHKNQTLADSGPYARIRHPLYVGSFFIALGYGLMNGTPWGAPGVGLLFCAIHVLAIRREEAQLLARHGQRYEAYRGAVPAVIPRLAAGQSGAGTGAFQWSTVWQNKEHHSIAALIGIVALFARELGRGAP